MTRTISLTLSVLLLLSVLAIPTVVSVTAEPTPTTTTAMVTTTSTWVLTGPDGINPDYTSTRPWTTTTTVWGCISTPPPVTVTTTTEPPVPTEGEVNLLAWAEIDEDATVSVLSYPSDIFDLCADCYTNNGAQVHVQPLENGPWDISAMRYLHMTVRTNMPFTVTLNDTADSKPWFAAAAGTDVILPAGGYCIVIDLFERFTQGNLTDPFPYTIDSLTFDLLAAGSISVGHIALSNSAVCDEPIPNIQTTTKPSFPWDTTTGYTTTTTSTWGFTTTTTLILTGPDGTAPTTFLTTTTTTVGHTDPTTAPPTTTSTAAPVYTSGKPITSTRPTVNPTVGDALLPGDMNGDGQVNVTDAFSLYRAVSKGEILDCHRDFGDMNSDGKINITDAFLLYAVASGR